MTAAGPLCGDSLLTGSAPFPWEQFVDLRVGVIGYAADDVAKPSLGIDVVQASGLDERVYDSGAAAAFIRAGEQIVFSSEGQRPYMTPTVRLSLDYCNFKAPEVVAEGVNIAARAWRALPSPALFVSPSKPTGRCSGGSISRSPTSARSNSRT